MKYRIKTILLLRGEREAYDIQQRPRWRPWWTSTGLGSTSLRVALALLKDLQRGPRLPRDGEFEDPALATYSIGLHATHDEAITNCAYLLVRPLDIRSDESGEHPGEQFVQVTITRAEVRELLADLEADWADHVQHTGGEGGAA